MPKKQQQSCPHACRVFTPRVDVGEEQLDGGFELFIIYCYRTELYLPVAVFLRGPTINRSTRVRGCKYWQNHQWTPLEHGMYRTLHSAA